MHMNGTSASWSAVEVQQGGVNVYVRKWNCRAGAADMHMNGTSASWSAVEAQQGGVNVYVHKWKRQQWKPSRVLAL